MVWPTRPREKDASKANRVLNARKAEIKRAVFATVVNRYLDHGLRALPLHKQAAVRRIQLELSSGRDLVDAIALAKPHLNKFAAAHLAVQLRKAAMGSVCSPAGAAPTVTHQKVFHGSPSVGKGFAA